MFDDIIGHQKTLDDLSVLLNNRTGGMFIFHGSPGVGKRTIAIAAAKALLCLKKVNHCSCPSCKRMGADHPDFFSVGQKEKIKTADVESFLEFMGKTPFISGQKVAVMDNAEDITWEASNRMLKVLEEHSNRNFVFLVTANPDRILPTIRSRCVKVKFSSLNLEDMANILWKKMGFDLVSSRMLSRLGYSGNLDIMSRPGTYLDTRRKVAEFLPVLEKGDLNSWFDYVDRVPDDDITIFWEILMAILTDTLYLQNHLSDEVVNKDLEEKLFDFSEKFNQKTIVYLTSLLCPLREYVHLNIDLRTHLKNVFMKAYPALQAEQK